MKRTIAVDFDGVLHRYDSPWTGPEHIPDPPVEGAFDWLNQVIDQFDVVIYSTRLESDAAELAMLTWFTRHGLPARTLRRLRFSAGKPPAILYLDDRGYRFEGEFPTIADIKSFKPWNKR